MPNSRTEQVTFTSDSYYADHYEDGTSTTDVWVTPTEDSTVQSTLPDYI